MNQNEYDFARGIVNMDNNINEAISYIKENFHVDAVYDEENQHIVLSPSNITEGLAIIEAKKYVDDNFDPMFVTTSLS